MTLKRNIANLIERLSGNLVLAPTDLLSRAEALNISKLFKYLNVDCAFDIGANDGQYADRLRDEIGFRGPIISYEPIPSMAQRMKDRKERSAWPWYIEAMAMDREAGPAVFHVAQENQFSSLHTPAAEQDAGIADGIKTSLDVTVQRSTLALELPAWQAKLGFRRPFLKMDTQGNEMAIIEGAGPALRTFVGIQTELAMRPLYDGAPGYAQVLEALAQSGFAPTAFLRSNEDHFPGMFDVDCLLYNTALAATSG